MLNVDHRAVVMGTLRSAETDSPDMGRRKRPLSIIEEHLDEDTAVAAPPTLAEEMGRGEGGGKQSDSPVLGRRQSPQHRTPPPATTAKKTRKKAVVFDHHPFFASPGQPNGTDSVRSTAGSDVPSPAGSDTAAALLRLRDEHQLAAGLHAPRDVEVKSRERNETTPGDVCGEYHSRVASHQSAGHGRRGEGGGVRDSSAERTRATPTTGCPAGVSAEEAASAGMTTRQGHAACCGQRESSDRRNSRSHCATSPNNECSECLGDDTDDIHHRQQRSEHQHPHHRHWYLPERSSAQTHDQTVRRVSQNGRLSESGGEESNVDPLPASRRVSPNTDGKDFPSRWERRFSPQTAERKLSIPDSSSPARRPSPQPTLPPDSEGKPSADSSFLSMRRVSPQPVRRSDQLPWQIGTCGSPYIGDGASLERINGGTERDLTRLKDTATKLNLKTRRPSYLTWRAKYIDKPRGPPEVKVVPGGGGGGSEGDGKLTQERKARMDNALEWIKRELIDLRRQDQSLAKQLLGIRHELSSLRLAVSCEEHQDLLDDAQEQMEELRELSRFVDFPPEMLDASSSPLRQIGVTKMNLSSRRFSTC